MMHYEIARIVSASGGWHDDAMGDSKALYMRSRHICLAVDLIKTRESNRAPFRDVLYQAGETAAESGARSTAIYYFDTENCTESRLRFRQESTLDEDDMQYEQDDHDPLSKIFGTNSMREEPAVQEIGSVDTRQGRLLVFPNTLQHLVEPFSLVDKSKSGI